MDFWRAYITGAEEHVPEAAIVHDKFHIMKYMNEAVDKVRRKENKYLMAEQNDTLIGTKYLWLKAKKNFTKENKNDFMVGHGIEKNYCGIYGIIDTKVQLESSSINGIFRQHIQDLSL